jgi:hypothetical protein
LVFHGGYGATFSGYAPFLHHCCKDIFYKLFGNSNKFLNFTEQYTTNKGNKMKIPYKLLNKWESLRSRGDVTRLSELSGFSRNVIYSAFDTGECNDELFQHMAEYYQEKETRFSEFLNDYQD